MRIRSLIIFALITFVFIACKNNKDVSNSTGWEYNNEENGGFSKADYQEQETGPGLVLVQGGVFLMGAKLPNPVIESDNPPRNVTVQTFYMDETEVRNIDYVEYLYWLSRVFGKADELYRKAEPDTMVWYERLAYNEPLSNLYLRHPSFQNYPVVGVSWTQANDYCLWRSDRVNEKILVDRGVIEWNVVKAGDDKSNSKPFTTDAYMSGTYKGLLNADLPDEDGKKSRKISVEDGVLLPNYRLPTEAEWEYAALAQIGNTVDERIYQRNFYPWKGKFLRNPDKKYRGKFRANFKRARGDYAGVAEDLNDAGIITNDVKSYWPNDFGLYNMAGNVAEWVRDVYRPLSYQDFSDLQPFRGNIFSRNVMDSATNTPQFDKMGHFKKEYLTNVEDRENIRKADNINYKDGDEESLSNFDFLQDDNFDGKQDNKDSEGTSTNKMYDPNRTLISDKSRVVKGGSWIDPVYYLSPSIRRYYDEDKAANFIGFRCAMDRVGSAIPGK